MQATQATTNSALGMGSNSTPSPSGRTAESQGWGAPLGLAAVIFGVYLFVSFGSSIWDRDEARFSRATAEMVATGNYLYPTFNGKLRPDKPILIYWLMSIPVKMFGHHEWAYRLCSVLGTTLACLFTYSIGRRHFSHRTGLWAMALLAANPMMLYTGAVATSDAVLLAFITGCFAVFADALARRMSAKHVAALAVLFSCGMLTKGPVSLLPAVPFILTVFLLRRELGSPMPTVLKLLASVVIACGVFLAWFIPANTATHNDLYNQMVVHHAGERMVKPLEGHGGYSFFYLIFYAVVVIVGFFPWTLYLPGALMRLAGGSKADDGERNVFVWLFINLRCGFSALLSVWGKIIRGEGEGQVEERRGRALLLTWIATFAVVMLAISTKLPHYILPIWPALALCVGAYLESTAPEESPSAGALWTMTGGFLFLVVALGLTLGLGFGPEYLSGRFAEWLKEPGGLLGLGQESRILAPKMPEPLWLRYADDSRSVRSIACALILIVSLPLLFRHRVAHFLSNANVLLGAAVLAVILMSALLLPSFERVKISLDLADQIHKQTSDDTPVTLCGYNEASLIFYLNRTIEDIVPDKTSYAGIQKGPRLDPKAASKIVEQSILDWAKKRGKGVLIIPRPMYEKMKPMMPELEIMGEVKNGFNYSKGHWVDILALRRID